MTEFEVVGCKRCDQLWILEAGIRRVQDTMQCPLCFKQHKLDNLRAKETAEEFKVAAEIRARILAVRTDEIERYQDEPDYGVAKELAEDVEIGAERGAFYDSLVDVEDFWEAHREFLEDEAEDVEIGAERGAFYDSLVDAEGWRKAHRKFLESEAEDVEIEHPQAELVEELLDEAESDDEQPAAGRFDDENPQVRATRSDLHDADVRIMDPQTGPRAHQALLDAGLDELLIEALGELPGERTGYAEHLREEVGVTALDGHFADVAAKAATAIHEARLNDVDVTKDGIADREQLPSNVVGEDDQDPVEKFLELARSLGSGMSSTAYPTSTDDLQRGTPAIFADARSEPTVAIELTGAFFERERGQREDVLELVLALGHGCEVVLVPSGIAAARLYKQHHDKLPVGVTERLDPQRLPSPHVTEGRPKTVEERISEAKDVLDHDGSKARVLRALRDADAHALTYEDLRVELGLEGSHPRVIATRLEDHGLVERIERPDGRTALSLLAPGIGLLDDWRRLYGEETTLSTFDGDGPSADADSESESGGDRYASPKNHLPCSVRPQDLGDPTPGQPGSAPAAAAEGDRTERYAHGAVDVEYMEPAREAAVLGSARSGEVSLLNAELHRQLDRNGDGRAPSWGYDERRDTLVVGAEYFGPLQWWASIARALADPKTWRHILDVDRVGEHLEGLETQDLEKLRQRDCIGWIPDEIEDDYDELADQFREAYHELGKATQPLKSGEYQDRDNCRGEILSMAHGLAGAMTSLLRLAGVDVVREKRIPRFSDDFSAGGHARRRSDLCLSIAFGAAIASSYKNFSAFRQLLEDRPDKIKQALEPPVDAEDPIATMHGSFVVTGHGVEDLEDELRSMLSKPKEVRDDAPEFATKIPVRAGYWPTTTRRVAKKIGRQKRIEPGHREIAALHGFANDPYAVAEGMYFGLQSEDQQREMYLDEVRTALASLLPIDDHDRETFARDRLLRGSTKAPRDGVRTLLRADKPISQAEIERRGGCSTESWRNHRDALQAAGLVEETSEGWRLTLPFHEERYEDDVDVAEPWILDPEDRFGSWSSATTVVDELAAELDAYDLPIVNEMLTVQYPETGPPYDEPLEAMGAGLLVRFVDAAFYTEPEPPAALLGPDLEQLSIRDLESVTDPPKISYGAD